jgi:hypothetical protein
MRRLRSGAVLGCLSVLLGVGVATAVGLGLVVVLLLLRASVG